MLMRPPRLESVTAKATMRRSDVVLHCAALQTLQSFDAPPHSIVCRASSTNRTCEHGNPTCRLPRPGPAIGMPSAAGLTPACLPLRLPAAYRSKTDSQRRSLMQLRCWKCLELKGRERRKERSDRDATTALPTTFSSDRLRKIVGAFAVTVAGTVSAPARRMAGATSRNALASPAAKIALFHRQGSDMRTATGRPPHGLERAASWADRVACNGASVASATHHSAEIVHPSSTATVATAVNVGESSHRTTVCQGYSVAATQAGEWAPHLAT